MVSDLGARLTASSGSTRAEVRGVCGSRGRVSAGVFPTGSARSVRA